MTSSSALNVYNNNTHSNLYLLCFYYVCLRLVMDFVSLRVISLGLILYLLMDFNHTLIVIGLLLLRWPPLDMGTMYL